jgi:drug/metabolite transporter (DMT)-like permease
LFGLILLGVFQLGISYILYAEAIKHVTALEGILIPILEPILNPVWVFLVIGETPGNWAVVGGIIVLISVTLRCISALKPVQ